MHFIDEVKIFLRSGNGGNGCVSFLREKFKPNGGPDGGNGGDGGSIIFHSSSELNTLINFRYKQHFYAKNGSPGKSKNQTGKSSLPLILTIPVGTQIFSENGKLLIYDFKKSNEYFKILTGGKGGLGNHCFKSSTNRSPRYATQGEIGSELYVWLKLKLLSDVGIIGMPNAGKSTLLSVLTAAKPKIADYPFTTLIPNLGVVKFHDKEFTLADIPGLIKGAHLGHGLGHRFLKHIERCKIILHLIDCTNENVLENYIAIKNEMESYSSNLLNKPEIICLTKIELIQPNILKKKLDFISNSLNKKIFSISAKTNSGIDYLLQSIANLIQSTHSSVE